MKGSTAKTSTIRKAAGSAHDGKTGLDDISLTQFRNVPGRQSETVFIPAAATDSNNLWCARTSEIASRLASTSSWLAGVFIHVASISRPTCVRAEHSN